MTMTTIPGHHLMAVKDIHDSGEVFTALLRDHEALVDEVHRLREKNRQVRRWASLWKAMARIERVKRQGAEADRDRLGLRDFPGVIARLKGNRRRPHHTALVVASFAEGRAVIDALRANGLDTPRDVAVVRLGTPDLDSDHLGRLTIAGRPSTRAAQTVLARLDWRWRNPAAPFWTHYDTPELAVFDSSAATIR